MVLNYILVGCPCLVIGKMYLRYLFETEMLPRNLRVDRGTETGKMATVHVYLFNKHEDVDDPCVAKQDRAGSYVWVTVTVN